MTQLSFLAKAIDERIAERGRPIFWRQIKNMESQNVTYFFPIYNPYGFLNYKFLFNAVSSEKRV